MEILTDNTIDESSAKYFCVFAGKDITKYFSDINDNDKIIKSTEKLITRKSTVMNEAEGSSIISKIRNGLSKLKDNAAATAQKTIKNTTATSTQAAIDTVTSAENQKKLNDLAANAGNQAGQNAVQGAIDGYNANKAAFDTMAHDAGAQATKGALDTIAQNNEQINQLAADAGASATQSALNTAVANQAQIDAIAHSAGQSAAAGALDTLKTAASSAAQAAMPWLISAGVMAIGYKLWPNIKGLFKKMTRTQAKSNNSIAFVKFKDTDNNDWQFYFSLKTLLWKLDNMNSGEDINKAFTIEFMKTTFAQRFMGRCQQIITSALNNELNIDVVLKASNKDKDIQKFIEDIVKNKDKIYSRMFTGKC